MSKFLTSARITKWLVSGPPFLYLTLFFLLPSLIMVVASFRYPGDYGGLAPIFGVEPGKETGLTLETYRFFFSDFIYTQVFIKSFGVALATTLVCLLMAYLLGFRIPQDPHSFPTRRPAL